MQNTIFLYPLGPIFEISSKPIFQLQALMTEGLTQETLREMASLWLPAHRVPNRFRIHTDTTDFFRVDYDDVLILGEKPYLIRHNAKEMRFGLEEETKFWVKRAIDLEDGNLKIIKLVFRESFIAHVGGIEFECFRSPKKEARILDLVKDHKNFMHGYWIEDQKGNVIRVLDFIEGKSLSDHIIGLNADHKSYYQNHFPVILDHFIESVRAIDLLHLYGEKHGDIRRDHILVDREEGEYRWIDFDYNYRHGENIWGYDMFGLGNILLFLAGKGDVVMQELRKQNHPALTKLTDQDVNIVFQNRVVNLKKIYPYIHESLNQVLMHFSRGANLFYENTTVLLHDLLVFRNSI